MRLLLPFSKIGLSFTAYLPVDLRVIVNAEEEPGLAYDLDPPISDWSIGVTLSDVSEPIADVA